MNNVEKLIARLVDEHKLTGEEAVILIKAVHQIDQNKSSTIDDLIQAVPHKNDVSYNCCSPYQQDCILTNNNVSTTY